MATPLTDAKLSGFCQKWKISKLELFGSARFDWDSARDVDLLVSFEDDAQWSLLDHVEMQDELALLLNRPVDLVTRRSIEASHNPIRREAILKDPIEVYAAR